MSDNDFISSFYSEDPKKKSEKPPPSPPHKKKIVHVEGSAELPSRAAKEQEKKEIKKKEEPIDFEKEFSRLSLYHDELQKELEAIYSATGLTHQSIQFFLDNPNNFESEVYHKAQIQRQKLRQELMNTLTPQSREAIERREKKQMQSRRKKKNIGTRRKWMTMD